MSAWARAPRRGERPPSACTKSARRATSEPSPSRVPTAKLGHEQVEKFQALPEARGLIARVRLGRERPDPDHPDFADPTIPDKAKTRMCRDLDAVADAQEAMLDVQSAVCRQRRPGRLHGGVPALFGVRLSTPTPHPGRPLVHGPREPVPGKTGRDRRSGSGHRGRGAVGRRPDRARRAPCQPARRYRPARRHHDRERQHRHGAASVSFAPASPTCWTRTRTDH